MKYCKIFLAGAILFCASERGASQSLPNSASKQYYLVLQNWLRDSVKVKSQLESFVTTPLDDLFDWNEITRRAFAENWVNLSGSWQKRYTQAVRKCIMKTTASRLPELRAYLHEKNIRWEEESINKDKAKTGFHFVRDNAIEKISLRLLFSGETWKVYDVRTENFRLIRDVLSAFDDLISNGFSHEYVEAVIVNDTAFTIDNFNANEDGDYPKLWGWRKKDDDYIRANKRLYFIQKENEDAFLSSETSDASVALVKPFSYHIKEYPYLSWRWRLREFSAGRETDRFQTQITEVVVIFYQNWLGAPVTLHYVWDPTASPCATIRKEGFMFDSYAKVIRTESTPSDAWFIENVNPFEDYGRIFGEDPPEQIIGIYLSTESDSGQAVSKIDFDDFVVRKATNLPSCSK
ncbi:DUF3047 domain-containing protein [bacterium]|nr:MAG: DUF3047 domain-containing protein [bacterium]